MLKKVCSKCGIEKEASSDFFNKHKEGLYGFRADCKECQKLYNVKWRDKNPQYNHTYYMDNKELKSLKTKTWKHINKERVNQYNKVWRLNNQGYIKRKSLEYAETKRYKGKKWREENPELEYLRKRVWRSKNKDKLVEYQNKRRALKDNLPSGYSTKDWDECKNYFENKCAYCNEELKLTQDHFIPVSKGGGYISSNIIPCCISCNTSKNNNDFEEWYKKQDYYSDINKNKIYNYINLKHLN